MTSGWKCSSSGYFSGGVFAKSHGFLLRKSSSWRWIPEVSPYGTYIRSAAVCHSVISDSFREVRCANSSNRSGLLARICSSVLAAAQRLALAIRLVKALLLTTVLYSSGPVTPLMQNRSLVVEENPRL